MQRQSWYLKTRVETFTDSSLACMKLVCELSSLTWSVVAGSCRTVCRHACLPSGPLGLQPLCALLPNQAAQYAEQPPRWPHCSAPSHWPPLKLWSRAGLSCAQSAAARCQEGWMAERALQRNKRAWTRYYWQILWYSLPTLEPDGCYFFLSQRTTWKYEYAEGVKK